jgi:hypothetical protein
VIGVLKEGARDAALCNLTKIFNRRHVPQDVEGIESRHLRATFRLAAGVDPFFDYARAPLRMTEC